MIDASDCLRGLGTVERRILDVPRVRLYEVAQVAQRTAKDTTLFHDRTGRLRGKIDIVDVGAFEKRVIARMPYSRFIEDGTKAHVIRPKRARFLRFYVAGETVFARRVNHPGTAKRPFMENAARAGGQAMRLLIDEGVERAINNP